MLKGIKIMELFKKLLSIVYKGKEKNILLAKTKKLILKKELKKVKI